jgi:hypothetical protein
LIYNEKNLLLFTFAYPNFQYQKCISQDTTQSNLRLGARYSLSYNYYLIHNTPVFSLEYKNNNLYFGPEFSSFDRPFGDLVDNYKESSTGINFGYRNYFYKSPSSEIRLFGQLNFSLYKYQYARYQKGPVKSNFKEIRIVENTGSLGLEYNFHKKLAFQTGLGIGSTEGFFLILSSFIPSIYFGLEFRFK